MKSPSSDIVSLTSLIHNLEERNKELEETVFHLQSLLEISQSRMIELEARLGLHSANSNFPPSRDIASPPKPVNLRTKSGKKAGGQKNVKR